MEYISLWNHVHAIQADQLFPSTGLCSQYGYQDDKLRLSDREWHSPSVKLIKKTDCPRRAQSSGLRFETTRRVRGYIET
jgi:hypothetical protein